MKKIVVRTGLLAGAVVLGLAGPASAFECYNASRSGQGNASAAASPALASVEEFLSEFVGLCPAGVGVVVDGLHAEGFQTDMLINTRTLMASGLDKNHPERLHDGKAIDHLSEAFIGTAEELIPGAFNSCGAA